MEIQTSTFTSSTLPPPQQPSQTSNQPTQNFFFQRKHNHKSIIDENWLLRVRVQLLLSNQKPKRNPDLPVTKLRKQHKHIWEGVRLFN